MEHTNCEEVSGTTANDRPKSLPQLLGNRIHICIFNIKLDRPKSVRNRCVIQVLCGVFYVVTMLFRFFLWVYGRLSYDWVRSLPFCFSTKFEIINTVICIIFQICKLFHLLFTSFWKLSIAEDVCFIENHICDVPCPFKYIAIAVKRKVGALKPRLSTPVWLL